MRLDQKPYQFLYADGDQFTFMDTESFDQVQLDRALLGAQVQFLQDGMIVTIESYEGAPLGLTLPETVVMMVGETAPVVKGQTAAASYKPALLEGDIRTMVPPFIESGDRILVSTADGAYSKRAER